MSGNLDLRRACLAAAICAAASLALPVGVLSLLFLAPLAFYLTGYALVAAAFARSPIERPQQVLFSVGLSLGVMALAALPLNYLPGGVRAGWWALALVLVVFGGCAVASRRRPPLPARARAAQGPRLTVGGLLGFAAALLCTAVAVAIAFIPISADKAIGYTQLWAMPSAVGGQPGVRVGVTSDEQETLAYELRLTGPGLPAPVARRFRLDPGETREVSLGLAAQAAGEEEVAATLFRADRPQRPYRRVVLRAPLGGGG